jgi:hypothetical protein
MLAWVAIALLLPSSAGAQPEPASPSVREPSEAGALGIEFTGGLFGEAWNFNDGHETLINGSAGVWWTFVGRTSLLVEFQAMRVLQDSSRDAFVNGLTTVIRWHALVRDRWTMFVDVGPGISWSDTRTPPRGTAFNYLALAGTGVLARVGRQSQALVGFRWLHLSNNGREGRGNNPDIEALGAYAGLSVAF